MCGIVGIFAKSDPVGARLGSLFTPMLTAMRERGPDSSGIAVYRDSVRNGHMKYSLYEPRPSFDWRAFEREVMGEFNGSASCQTVGKYGLLTCDRTPGAMREWVGKVAPTMRIMGLGRQMEIYKDVGTPDEVVARYGVSGMSGVCMIGHTRMATESAVNVEGSHPYAAGEDLCVVHNGSFANHNTIRRELLRQGIRFDSWNDTEVAVRYLQWRLAEKDTLKAALTKVVDAFSGFFTLVIGLTGQFAVMRDPYACKPLVVAEGRDYIACASEFRALAHLPGIMEANLFEPKPQEVYVWSR